MVAVVLIGVVGILLLEEVDPALGQANGQRLVGRVHILPVPAAAVDIERRADGVHRSLEVVLEGALTGRAADGRGVRLGDKGEVNGVAVNLRGLADGVRGNGDGGGAGGSIVDLVHGGIGILLAADGNSAGAHLGDLALSRNCGGFGVGHNAVFNRQIVDIAFLKLVLDGILIVAANGILHFFAVGVEAMDKVGLAVSFHGAVILHAEIHVSLAAGTGRAVCLKGGSRRDQKRGKHREDK